LELYTNLTGDGRAAYINTQKIIVYNILVDLINRLLNKSLQFNFYKDRPVIHTLTILSQKFQKKPMPDRSTERVSPIECSSLLKTIENFLHSYSAHNDLSIIGSIYAPEKLSTTMFKGTDISCSLEPPFLKRHNMVYQSVSQTSFVDDLPKDRKEEEKFTTILQTYEKSTYNLKPEEPVIQDDISRVLNLNPYIPGEDIEVDRILISLFDSHKDNKNVLKLQESILNKALQDTIDDKKRKEEERQRTVRSVFRSPPSQDLMPTELRDLISRKVLPTKPPKSERTRIYGNSEDRKPPVPGPVVRRKTSTTGASSSMSRAEHSPILTLIGADLRPVGTTPVEARQGADQLQLNYNQGEPRRTTTPILGSRQPRPGSAERQLPQGRGVASSLQSAIRQPAFSAIHGRSPYVQRRGGQQAGQYNIYNSLYNNDNKEYINDLDYQKYIKYKYKYLQLKATLFK